MAFLFSFFFFTYAESYSCSLSLIAVTDVLERREATDPSFVCLTHAAQSLPGAVLPDRYQRASFRASAADLTEIFRTTCSLFWQTVVKRPAHRGSPRSLPLPAAEPGGASTQLGPKATSPSFQLQPPPPRNISLMAPYLPTRDR